MAKKTNTTGKAQNILLRPHVTEKSAMGSEKGVYTFLIDRRADKKMVEKAIEEIYGVSPVKINIVNKAPRATRSRGRRGKGQESGMKKAMVYLKEGDKIEIV